MTRYDDDLVRNEPGNQADAEWVNDLADILATVPAEDIATAWADLHDLQVWLARSGWMPGNPDAHVEGTTVLWTEEDPETGGPPTVATCRGCRQTWPCAYVRVFGGAEPGRTT